MKFPVGTLLRRLYRNNYALVCGEVSRKGHNYTILYFLSDRPEGRGIRYWDEESLNEMVPIINV